MARPSLSSRRSRTPVLGALLALLVAAIALPLATSTGSRAALRAQLDQCPRGSAPARDAGSDAVKGHPDCELLGHPESFAELATSNSQLGARDTAPFASSVPGAYGHAVAQRAAIPRAGTVPGSGNAWTQAGHSPECAQQTSGSSVCPPPSAENGNYNGVGTLGFRTLSGRISSYAYDPGTAGRIFASPVVGGVWESRDNGDTWHSIGDSLPTQVVGAIAYDEPLHRILVSTGDNSFGGSGIAGHGLFFSDDDGASWQAATGIPDLALGFKVVVSPADAGGRTVYAATSKGLFRSTDGGDTFVNENLPTTPAGYSPNCAGNTTNRLCFFANAVTDVVVKGKASANAPAGAVIAAVGWRAGQKVDLDASGNPATGCTLNGQPTNCLQAPQNGLYISQTGSPNSFTYSPGGSGGTSGFAPTPVVGRTALAIAHGSGQNPDAVYALVQDAQKFNGCPDVLDQVPPVCNSTVTGEGLATVLDGLYASYDFGKTWTKVMDSTQLKQAGTNSALLGQAGYNPGVQAWYNLWVEVDPTATDSAGAPTRLLFGLEEVWENNPTLPSGSGPGSVLSSPYAAYPGGTPASDPWIVIGRYWNACGGLAASPVSCNPNTASASPLPGTTTHPDQHAYAMIPDGKGGVTLFIGSDGGAYRQHVDAGQNFTNDAWGDGLNATITALQPYDAEMAKDGTIVSGLQDNGEMKTAPDGHEAEIYGGDAFYNTIDPDHSNNIIEEYTYAAASLTTDGGNSWYPIEPGSCSSSNSLFATPIEQDPTQPGHVLIGCGQIQEATNAYADPCANPDGGSANNCTATYSPFNTVYDLSTLPSPNGATNIPSALAVRGANEYVGYCGYCDPATQKVPFANGIATNVGGSQPPKIGAGDGWHQASAYCSGCGTANGKLPQRYINSIQEDPADPNTVWVTLGGYGRRWIPPGSFGEDVSNVGVGHVFVSHDHGEHFTNITGNLPDISANWTTLHDGRLIVATDLGVYIQQTTGSSPTYAVLGRDLPMAPVFTVRTSPADANLLLISTYGRGDFFYRFTSTPAPAPVPPPSVPPGGSHCPAATGSLNKTRVGPLSLRETRAAARAKLKRYVVQVPYGFDDFCMRGAPGIRAGYPSAKLLRELKRRARRSVRGRIVLLLTANRRYSIRGVRAGTTIRAARRRLGRVNKFHVGLNDWYLFHRRGVTWVLKVRRGKVLEVGVANPSLTARRAAQRRFIVSFRSA